MTQPTSHAPIAVASFPFFRIKARSAFLEQPITVLYTASLPCCGAADDLISPSPQRYRRGEQRRIPPARSLLGPALSPSASYPLRADPKRAARPHSLLSGSGSIPPAGACPQSSNPNRNPRASVHRESAQCSAPYGCGVHPCAVPVVLFFYS